MYRLLIISWTVNNIHAYTCDYCLNLCLQTSKKKKKKRNEALTKYKGRKERKVQL